MQQGGRYLRQRGSPDNLTHFNPYTYADIDTIADHLHFPGGNPYLDIEEHGALGGGHAHAGLMIYQGGAWPESYGDYALINNIHGAQINMDELLPKGSGFVGAAPALRSSSSTTPGRRSSTSNTTRTARST